MIRDAMKDKGRVALARIVFANREHILAVEPWGKGMLGTTLRYDYEVRDEKDVFTGIPSPRIPKEMIDLASHILDTKAGRFDASRTRTSTSSAQARQAQGGRQNDRAACRKARPRQRHRPDGGAASKREGRKAAALSTRSDSKKSAPAGKRRSKTARSRGRKPKAA